MSSIRSCVYKQVRYSLALHGFVCVHAGVNVGCAHVHNYAYVFLEWRRVSSSPGGGPDFLSHTLYQVYTSALLPPSFDLLLAFLQEMFISLLSSPSLFSSPS